MPDQQTWGEWLRENKQLITLGLSALYDWLKSSGKQGDSPDNDAPGVLIIGPGGVGKSTLGKILSGKFDFLFDLPGEYDESIEVEKFEALDGLDIVVPPGQAHRRESTWADHLEGLSAGKYRGLILIGAYGYHNDEIGVDVSYTDHPLYKGNKAEFLQAFLANRRNEELKVLREIASRVTPPPGGKFWMLTLVTKQDLWWDDRAAAEAFYQQGEYATLVESIVTRHGKRLFRPEVSLASLVISNFVTGRGESLQPNTAGYDHRLHAMSLRRLFEKLDALRRWEGEAV